MPAPLRIIALTLILTLSAATGRSAGELSYGLYFKAHTVDKEFRTNLHLTPSGGIDIDGTFALEFDAMFRMEPECFGYVFRAANGNNNHLIDLVSNIRYEEAFLLICDGKQVLSLGKSEITGFGPGEWTRIRVSIDPASRAITLQIGDCTKRGVCEQRFSPVYDIYFGGNDHEQYFTSDVSPMTVRDIRIFEQGNPKRHWALAHHKGSKVYDLLHEAEATAANPVWEIDNHAHWRLMQTFTVKGQFIQSAYDQQGGRLFIARGNKIYTYYAQEDSLDVKTAVRGTCYENKANSMVYDPLRDQLVSYYFESAVPARYDIASGQWDNEDYNETPLTKYWHHNQCFIARTDELVTFGGYGFHTYKAQLQRLHTGSKAWSVTDLSDFIAPRYLSSMTYAQPRNRLLVFGGYGSRSGGQQEAPCSWFDLYSIDLATGQTARLGDYSVEGDSYICSNSMVYDHDKNKIYTLTYSNRKSATSILLREYYMGKEGGSMVLGDSIPYFFNDVESYCALYHCTQTGQLLAMTSSLNQDMNTLVNIYAINYPPLAFEDTYQDGRKPFPVWCRIATTGVGLALLCAAAILYRRRRARRKAGTSTENAEITFEAAPPSVRYNHEKRPSSIYLLGGFQVIDRNGEDITGHFTQTVKHMFLLILLETFKTGKGISSGYMRDQLWFDKDEESARNNRNVNMRKLRLLLAKIGDVTVSIGNSYWQLEIGEEVFCDYTSILAIAKQMKKEGVVSDTGRLNQFIQLALHGKLLINTQTEWIDAYKSEFSSLIIDTMLEVSKQESVRSDYKLLLKLSNVIMLHDSIEEDGIRLKCHALFHMGQKGLAKQCFDNFRDEYEKLLGVPPSLEFKDLVKP